MFMQRLQLPFQESFDRAAPVGSHWISLKPVLEILQVRARVVQSAQTAAFAQVPLTVLLRYIAYHFAQSVRFECNEKTRTVMFDNLVWRPDPKDDLF